MTSEKRRLEAELARLTKKQEIKRLKTEIRTKKLVELKKAGRFLKGIGVGIARTAVTPTRADLERARKRKSLFGDLPG